MKQGKSMRTTKFDSCLPTAPCMKPRIIKLAAYGQNSDSSMFDFLKDRKYTENKYNSTSQIPLICGEDLFGHTKGEADATEDTHMSSGKDEIFTPFFAIEEDLEMEDAVSNSDDVVSEQEQYIHQCDLSGSSGENKSRAPKRVQSTKQTPFLGLLGRKVGFRE